MSVRKGAVVSSDFSKTASTEAVWQGFACADCGKVWRTRHHCRHSGAHWRAVGERVRGREPFQINATSTSALGVRFPSSLYVEP